MTDTAQTPPEQPAAEAPPQVPPAKENWIDFDQLPEPQRDQVRARFGTLFKTVKKQESQLEEVTQQLKALVERDRKAEETRRQQSEQQLENEKVRALEKADYKAVAQIDKKLRQLEIDAVKPVKAEPAKPLTNDDRRTLYAWQNEVDDEGRFARPWAQPTHRLFNEVTSLMSQISDRFPTASMHQVLEMTQRQVTEALKAKSAQTPVVNSDATPNAATTGKAKLSAAQQHVAHNMYRNQIAAKELSLEQAEERYWKSLQKVGRA